jgi:hypothetical protein
VTAPAVLFGASNSEGSMRMEEWLQVMCRGCVKDRGRGPSGGMGGIACPLPAGAYADPHADVAEWSPDAAPVPERVVAELDRWPWYPVCMSYSPRKRRSDAGRPRVADGQGALL